MALGETQNWLIRKPAISSKAGLVSAQNLSVAAIGADVLASGGNAVDAAVTTAFAMGVAEPWMSGIGGGGVMTLYRANDRSTHVIDFNMVASQALDPADYPAVKGEGGDLFTWPKVRDDRNVLGYKSICVPGAVDGLALALDRFGSIGFDRALGPAIELAEQGIAVNWFTSLVLATGAAEMAQFSEARDIFMPGGHPLVAPPNGTAPPMIRQPRLAATLRQLADEGPRAFYEGEIAETMVADMATGGGYMTLDDLAGYRSEVRAPLSFAYRDMVVHTTPDLTAGPTLRDALDQLAKTLPVDAALDGVAILANIRALQAAYERRFAGMGHAGDQNSCTTHICVVDAMGNMVSLTNTLLSRFGSKVVLPQSGVLMNNGVMWFDTRPGTPNAIAPGARPLCNMCPTILTRDGVGELALGAAGGRQIVSAVCQLISLIVDHGLDLDQAIHHPRFDMSGAPEVTLETRMPLDWVDSIAAAVPVRQLESTVYPVLFALASAVARDNTGPVNAGVAEPSHPLAGVAPEVRENVVAGASA
jgi:gamma-glutamyltranspeptidase / glutathione hydrolase